MLIIVLKLFNVKGYLEKNMDKHKEPNTKIGICICIAIWTGPKESKSTQSLRLTSLLKINHSVVSGLLAKSKKPTTPD